MRCGLPRGYEKNTCIVYLTQHMWKMIEECQIVKLTDFIYKLNNNYNFYDCYNVNSNIQFLFGEAI